MRADKEYSTLVLLLRTLLAVVLLYEIALATMWAVNGGVFWPQDQGIFSQVMWKIMHGRLDSSIYSEKNFFASHFTPIFILLAPLTKLFNGLPLHYLFVNAGLVLSLYFIYLAARRLGVADYLILMMLVVHVTTPLFFHMMTSGFRDAVVSVLPVSMAMYFFMANQWRLFLFSLVLALLCREDTALALVGFAFASWWFKREKKWILVSLFLPLVYFVVVVKLVMPWLAGDLARTGGLGFDKYGYLGGSLLQMVVSIVTNPGIVLAQLWSNKAFIWDLLAPWLFLPLLSPVIMLIPIGNFAEVLLARGTLPVASVRYWYIAPATPFITLAAMASLDRLGRYCRDRRRLVRIAGLITLAGLLLNILGGDSLKRPLMEGRLFTHGNRMEDVKLLTGYARMYPDATVSASYNTILFFAQRHTVRLIGTKENGWQPDLIVAERSSGAKGYNNISDQVISWPRSYQFLDYYLKSRLASKQYSVADQTGRVIILKKNIGAPGNGEEYAYGDFVSDLEINIHDLHSYVPPGRIFIKEIKGICYRCFTDATGTVVYGPYIYLPPGRYTATVTINEQENAGRSGTPIFQVYSNKGGELASTSALTGRGTDGRITLPFLSKGEDDIQFRILAPEKRDLCVSHIRLQRVKQVPAPLPEPGTAHGL